MSATIPGRTVVRYHGGKWILARKIIALMPPHRIYVEPFGGAGSVLMQKEPSYSEVYNDLDGEIVNLFRVLRDPATAAQFRRLCELTPYARDEFDLAYEPTDDPIEKARRTVVRGFMGYGSSAAHHTATRTGFRANACRSFTTPAHDWKNYPSYVDWFCERLRGVVIENRPALKVIGAHDREDALLYIDPPYVQSTRTSPKNVGKKSHYRHEMTDDDHRELADRLRSAHGFCIVSGYPSALYDEELFQGWPTRDFKAYAGAAGSPERTERVWLSPRTAAAIDLSLFREAS